MSRHPPRLMLAVLAVLASACADAPATIDARGPAAATIAVVWWVMLVLGSILFLITTVYLLVAALRPAPARGPRSLVGADERFITVWGIVVPAVVLSVVLGLTIWSGAQTYRPGQEPGHTIEVTGHQFWWEVRYPDAGGEVVTANEIHVPVGEPVRFVLEASDVIHSFWVPQLHGKMDQIPGHTNEFWFQADEAGEYRGLCAEYCGIQHAQMHFIVIAMEPEDFDRWIDEQLQDPGDAEEQGVAAGQQVFVEANCVSCHAVRGLGEPEGVGPDLTNLASRQTLGAGMLDNTREDLRQWILDPHAHKPGVLMPATPLADDDLEALLDYLETLE